MSRFFALKRLATASLLPLFTVPVASFAQQTSDSALTLPTTVVTGEQADASHIQLDTPTTRVPAWT